MYFASQMKILVYNVGYFLGHDGSLFQYLTHGYRYFFCGNLTREKNIANIRDLIDRYNPDICGLLEVHQATAGGDTLGDEFSISQDGIYHCETEVKYGINSILRKFFLFKTKSNAVMLRKKHPIKRHYLSAGTKRLVLEIEVTPDFSIFLVHLSIRKWIRKRQFYELKKLIKEKKRVVVCGDFNIFGGMEELRPLLKKTNLRIVNKKEHITYPASKPTKALDLFLCSRNLSISNIEVIDEGHSDHLPVIVEIDQASL